MGTDAAQQGGFRGSAALECALAACDASGLSSYLEATSARSAQLCRQFGFHGCPEPVALAPGAPMLYPLWRQAPA